MKNNFKVNDWVFSEFELKQVLEVEDGKVVRVSCGRFETFGMHLACYPLSLRIKNASDAVKYWQNQFHSVKPSSFNFPDLRRALESKWVHMCEAITQDKDIADLYEDLNKFGHKVMNAQQESVYIDNVKIFR